MESEEEIEDGWGEDPLDLDAGLDDAEVGSAWSEDDPDLNDETAEDNAWNSNAHSSETSAPVQVSQTAVPESSANKAQINGHGPPAIDETDGWGDDEFDFDVPEELPPQTLQSFPPIQSITQPNVTKNKVIPLPTQSENESFAWDDNDDLAFSDTDEAPEPKLVEPKSTEEWNPPDAQSTMQALSGISTVPPAPDTFAEGWDDDGDLEVEDATYLQEDRDTDAKLRDTLDRYLESLAHMVPSVSAVLATECNTPQKAAELLDYYSSRPALAEYTINKELARMEYIVTDGSDVFTEKEEIANALLSDASLVSRCANQSLLADLLQVFSGDDMLLRPQYMATAIAESCRFRLDLTQSLVQVDTMMQISLPTEKGRWKVADMAVHILFCPNPVNPYVEYHLTSIRCVPRDVQWSQNFNGAVEILKHLHPQDVSFDEQNQNFRDVFLQQSQNFLQNSAVGVRSAWQEIDAVAGFSNKLGKLPGFLPTDVMEAVEVHAPPPPKERPQSILGGLVRSGLSQLAKSVALPDEDPSLYEEWKAPTKTPTSNAEQLYSNPRPDAVPPTFYRKDGPEFPPVSDAPQLYRRDDVSAVQHAPEIQFESSGPSNTTNSKPKIDPKDTLPTEIPSSAHCEGDAEPEVEDGWDLEELDDDFELSGNVQAAVSMDAKNLEDSWVYDPETDILPTRKRWINPLPGPRHLKSYLIR